MNGDILIKNGVAVWHDNKFDWERPAGSSGNSAGMAQDPNTFPNRSGQIDTSRDQKTRAAGGLCQPQ